ncbi:hypothetical protein EV426DRAFT_721650 [Tirmania nivea]|nr:hypothetical protein EV426DRAFT_721650 [Tirmania nivea]
MPNRLYTIRKVDFPKCDAPQEDGHHVTFSCPHYAQQRRELIGDRFGGRKRERRKSGTRLRRTSPTSTAPH